MKFTCLFVWLLILICQAIGLAEEVEIPDPNLRRVLELALRINAGEGITKEALASLVSLNAADKGIIDLTGLGHCINLTVLDLSFNQLKDLNGLMNTNFPDLKVLYLYNQRIWN